MHNQQRKLTYVRFFRDYSIAELAFMFVGAVMLCYMAFGSFSASLQAGVCEELGRQPDLLRDMAESGLNLENCEYWFGRAAVGVLGVMLVFAVIRVSYPCFLFFLKLRSFSAVVCFAVVLSSTRLFVTAFLGLLAAITVVLMSCLLLLVAFRHRAVIVFCAVTSRRLVRRRHKGGGTWSSEDLPAPYTDVLKIPSHRLQPSRKRRCTQSGRLLPR